MGKRSWPLAAIALLSALDCAAQVRDTEMKAAYIFNFALFTSWPDSTARGALTVCAAPDSALWPSLHALDGKPVNGRPWLVVDPARTRSARCDILVLTRAPERPVDGPTLVVRDGAGGGAAITLVEDDEHVRFDVDTREAARLGLHFSSRLLRLARNVQ